MLHNELERKAPLGVLGSGTRWRLEQGQELILIRPADHARYILEQRAILSRPL